MAREQLRIKGRDGALAVLRSALRSCAQRGRLMVVRGPAGIGKSRMLAETSRSWRAQGVRVAEVHVGGGPGQDRYGVDAVVDALRKDFDRFGGPGLIDGISALVRLPRRDADERNAGFSEVVAELSRVFGRIGNLGPTAVLVDDVLEVADPAALLIAARRPGCLVVASTRADAELSPAYEAVIEMADEVLDLGTLADEDIAAVTSHELDEGVRQALRAALGPLYGNPGTVLATLEAMREDGRLVAAGDRFALADPTLPIALPSDHDLLRRADRLGGLAPRLLAAAAAGGVLDVDDLPLVADALAADPVECGRTVDRLVEHGLLVGDAWGRLHCACPALAAAIACEQGATLRRLLPAPTGRPVAGARATAGANASAVQFEQPALGRERGGVSPMKSARSRPWSAAEERIVELISTGLTNRQIGVELGMSEKTVESHLTRLFAKSGCRSRVALLAKANREGRLRSGAEAVLGQPAA